jgi:hypothetical protein
MRHQLSACTFSLDCAYAVLVRVCVADDTHAHGARSAREHSTPDALIIDAIERQRIDTGSSKGSTRAVRVYEVRGAHTQSAAPTANTVLASLVDAWCAQHDRAIFAPLPLVSAFASSSALSQSAAPASSASASSSMMSAPSPALDARRRGQSAVLPAATVAALDEARRRHDAAGVAAGTMQTSGGSSNGGSTSRALSVGVSTARPSSSAFEMTLTAPDASRTRTPRRERDASAVTIGSPRTLGDALLLDGTRVPSTALGGSTALTPAAPVSGALVMPSADVVNPFIFDTRARRATPSSRRWAHLYTYLPETQYAYR